MEEKDRQKEIEGLYDEYIAKLNELKKEQMSIINNFISEIEKKKLEKIRKEL